MLAKNAQKKLKLYGSIIKPDINAVVIIIFIAVMTLALYDIAHAFKTAGINDNTHVLNYILVDFDKVINKISTYPGINSAFPVLFWGVVGIFVYIFARLIVGDMDELLFDFSKKRGFLWPRGSHPHLIFGFFERIIWRLVIAILLVLYIVHFVSFFMLGHVLPVSFFGVSAQNFLSQHNIVNQIVFFICEVIVLYGFVVLVRLFSMRVRLFREL